MALTLKDLGIEPSKKTIKKEEPKKETPKPKKIKKQVKEDKFTEIVRKIMTVLVCSLIGVLSIALVVKGILFLFSL